MATIKEIKSRFKLDSSVPSGIVYKRTVNSMAKVGSMAGSRNNVTGYYQLSIGGKAYYSHHIVCLLAGIEGIDKVRACAKIGKRLFVVDHIDNNRDNNAPNNLRVLSNGDNIARSKVSNTGIHNVYSKRGGYIVTINSLHVGSCSTLEQAIKLKEYNLNKACIY